MSLQVKNKNYTLRYVVFTYIVFWLGVLLVGGIYLLTESDLVTNISTIPLSWIPTIILVLMFNKLMPNKTRKEWIKESFSQKINVWLICITTLAFILSVVFTYLIMFFRNCDVTSINFDSISVGSVIITIIYSIITGAMGEELGWRGYLQRYFENQSNGDVVKSAFKVGLIWSLWHIPLWFTSAGGESVDFLINHIITFTAQCMCLAIIIAICYNYCRNIFIPMWIHFLSNVTMSLIAPYFTTNSAIMEGKLWLTFFYIIITAIFILWNKIYCKLEQFEYQNSNKKEHSK